MEPAYLQSYPGMESFDYTTGQWEQAPTGFGQLSEDASQVRAQPYPHDQTIYPPQEAHSVVTTGPLRRGDPNLPAFAPAPYMGMDVYTQQNTALRPGAYAGPDLGAAFDYANPRPGVYRDVQGNGGWIYRQFKDGVIQILVSQNPALPNGTFLNAAAPQWNAITGEIGTWAMYASQRTAAVAKALVDGVKASASGLKSPKRHKKQTPSAPVPPSPVLPVETSSDIPTWAVVAGVAALVAGVAYVATRPKKERERK